MKQLFSIKIVALIICFFLSPKVTGQTIENVRINEIQVINKDGYKDPFGRAVSWIELFNSGHAKVNIGGAILKVKGKEYRIPKSTLMTIPKQGYLIFFAEGNTDRGPLYTNFTLEETNFIELYSPDDLEYPVDRLDFKRSDMMEDVTYGWIKGRDGVERLENLAVSTPGASNNTIETISRSEELLKEDPVGIILTITAVSVVGISLILLYLIFAYLGKLHINVGKKKKAANANAAKSDKVEKSVTDKKSDDLLTNEEIAAIAIALYKYSEDLHDIEDTVLTINRAAKAYSPWSSKIYGLTQTPIKK